MGPPLVIFLVRHGQTEWNALGRFQGRADVPLDEKGLFQARNLALVLRPVAIAAAYSSPLRRAIETAQEILMHHPRVPLTRDPDLVEMDLGDFDGMEAGTWAKCYPEFLARWRERPSKVRMPKGETLEEVSERALRFLHRLTLLHNPGQNVLVCTHNFVCSAILCHVLSIPLDRFREATIPTGSFVRIFFTGEKPWVERMETSSGLPGGHVLEGMRGGAR